MVLGWQSGPATAPKSPGPEGSVEEFESGSGEEEEGDGTTALGLASRLVGVGFHPRGPP